MQAFSLDNNKAFQIKFPRPSSKSQSKPPRDSKDINSSILTDSKNTTELYMLKEPPAKKVLKDLPIENSGNEADFFNNFEEKLRGVLVENEKLRKKLEFVSNMFENLLKFDENKDVFELKAFVRTNYKQFHGILDEIFYYKEEIEKTKQMYVYKFLWAF